MTKEQILDKARAICKKTCGKVRELAGYLSTILDRNITPGQVSNWINRESKNHHCPRFEVMQAIEKWIEKNK